MLTKEQIKNNVSNYRIENGTVIDKNTNQPVIDNEKILEIKTSIMMYREAKQLFDKKLRGAPVEQDYYIEKALMIYGLNGEINDYPQNKMIRQIINSNGTLQIDYGGNDLSVSEKFSFLYGQKKEYGLATIKYMAHQQGIDISNLDISIDLSEFKKIGVSKVNIRYDKQPYQKQIISNEPTKAQEQPKQQLYQHPKANELNELEKQKQIAKQNGDEVAYSYAQKNIERIISENQAMVSPEQWDSMSIDEKKSFIETKINESKILHDKDSFDYWNANLKNLKQIKSPTNSFNQNDSSTNNHQYESTIEQSQESMKSSDSLDFSVMINQLRTQNILISEEYKKMFEDGVIDDEELAILIKRLKDLENNALAVKSMVSDKNQEVMIDSIIEMINQGKNNMTTMQRGIEETTHSFGK